VKVDLRLVAVTWILNNTTDCDKEALGARDRESEDRKRIGDDIRIFTKTPKGNPRRIYNIKTNQVNRKQTSFIKNTGACQAKNGPNPKYL
jgi:hypothetical protein